MKMKKLLSFLLCFVIIFAGLPSVVSQAAETSQWQTLEIYGHTLTKDNYTKSYYGSFTVSTGGVIKFESTRLLVNGQQQKFYFKIYDANDDTVVWSSNTDKLSLTTDSSCHYALVGLKAGNYIAEITPSMYSSSFSSGQSYYVPFGFFYYTAATNFEAEDNDTKQTANALKFGSTVRAFSDSSEDWFSVYTSKDCFAKIRIANYDKLTQNNVFVKVWDSANNYDYLLSSEAAVESSYYIFYVQLKAGTNYINVTASSKVGQQEYWVDATQITKLPTPVFNKFKRSSKTLEGYWNTIPGVDGYEIQRKINKGSWTKVLTNNGDTRNGFTQSNTNLSNTYQFRVRAFKRIGTTTLYSSWSSVKAYNPTPTNIKLSYSAYTYNGKTRKPTVTVKNKLGSKLKEGTDYKVTYASGRKKIGKYKVKITFKGNYSGTKYVYFKINPKGTSVSKVTAAKKSLKVKLKKQTSNTSGYQVQYSTSKKFKSYKTVTVKSNKTTSVTLKSLKAKKTYYVRVRTYKTVSGTKYYSSWSSYKTKKTK